MISIKCNLTRKENLLAMALTSGLITGLGLIVAPGPQNLYILWASSLRRCTVWVVLAAFLSDTLLIGLGAFGLGGALSSSPTSMWWSTLAGMLFVGFFSIQSGSALIESLRRSPLPAPSVERPKSTASRRSLVGKVAAFSLLNPHAVLDTTVLLGTASSAWGEHSPAFALGAMAASGIWFSLLGVTGHLFAGTLERPRVRSALHLLSFLFLSKTAIDLGAQLF
jgi:L-lysine exporter family protein LysE/ArgO